MLARLTLGLCSLVSVCDCAHERSLAPGTVTTMEGTAAPLRRSTEARRRDLGLADPPPRDERVCVDGAHERPTEHSCRTDEDCVVCHDGSACGVIVNLDEFERRGDDCTQQDAADCEYTVPRCCNDRCVRSSH